MSWIGDLIGGGAEGVLKGVGSLAKDIRTAITGEEPLTAEQRSEIALKLQAMEEATMRAAAEFDTKQMEGQVELLKIDQSSDSTFRGGWRPAVGWICAFGLGYTFVLRPLLPWAVKTVTIYWTASASLVPELPPLETDALMTLLVGMLGLGGMRTFEKVRKG